MTQPRTTPNGPAFLSIGVVFLAVGIVFLTTNMGPTWIPFFTLGVVFLTISASGFARKRTDATEEPEPPEQ